MLWRNRRTFLTALVLGLIVSVLVAYILPEYYRSTTSIFTVKLSQIPINETSFRRGNIGDFGETTEAEQAIELLNSTRLREKIIDKWDLYKHYQIDQKAEAAKTYVLKTLDGNTSISRTRFNSIEISVLDKDPQMAADIANSFAVFLDSIKYEMVQSRALSLLGSLESQARKQQMLIDTLKKSMDFFSNNGVMSQFQRGYLIEAFAQSSPTERAQLKKLVDSNILYGEEFDKVERIYEKEIDNLIQINKFVVQTRADVDTYLTQKFIMDKAVPAQKKSFPIRWLVVVVGLSFAALLAILLIFIREKQSDFRQAIGMR